MEKIITIGLALMAIYTIYVAFSPTSLVVV